MDEQVPLVAIRPRQPQGGGGGGGSASLSRELRRRRESARVSAAATTVREANSTQLHCEGVVKKHTTVVARN